MKKSRRRRCGICRSEIETTAEVLRAEFLYFRKDDSEAWLCGDKGCRSAYNDGADLRVVYQRPELVRAKDEDDDADAD